MLETSRVTRIAQAVALVAIVWFAILPLRDVLAFPDRISVVPNLEADAAAYDAFARDLAGSWHLSALPSKHPPGWMVLLASVYSVVGHSYVAGKLASWVAFLLTVLLCAWLADRLYGRGAAFVAALLCASSPGLRGYVGTLQYEVVTATLFSLFLVLSTRSSEATNSRVAMRRALLAGVAGAALILTRETFVLVVPIAAWWVWSRLGRTALPTRQAALVATLLVAAAAVPAITWSIVQTLHHQRLVLISEKGPKEFELGNNPLANGTYNEPLVGMAEPAGFAYIRSAPLHTLELVIRKPLYLFGVLRDGWNVPHPAATWIWRATTGAVPLAVIEPIVRGGWLLVACLTAPLILGREKARTWWLLPATVGAIVGVHVATLGSYRFAIPLLPILYVIASGPVWAIASRAATALRSPMIAAVCGLILALGVAAQFRSWPLQVEFDAADLDGIAAANEIDSIAGARVRFADARRGVRPVALLTDEYLPGGLLNLSVRMRRVSDAPDSAAIARITLVQLDGRVACAEDVQANRVPLDRFTDIATRCRLPGDGPVTFAVHSLGTADLAIDAVGLRWIQ